MIVINDKTHCNGCYACSQICPQNCIEMVSDEEGFWYPNVDLKQCIDCDLCERVCPIINPRRTENNPRAYAGYCKDEAIRMQSSSGGIFSLVAEQVISQNGIVFGAMFTEEFQVIHGFVDNQHDLEKLRGSKYVQSNIGDTYRQAKTFLTQGKKVLFTGTPCQIGGLKAYLGKEYDNLICMDLICHGVPSPKVWQMYLDYRCGSKEENGVEQINFRSKTTGWKNYSILFRFLKGETTEQTFKKDLYMNAFLKNVSLRPSCYRCAFKSLNRESDITLGDFWGIQHLMPELDDNKGTSLIFINSEKGEAFFHSMKPQMIYKETDLHQAIVHNQAAIKSVTPNKNREVFFQSLNVVSFSVLVKRYCMDSFMTKLKRKVKKLIRST